MCDPTTAVLAISAIASIGSAAASYSTQNKQAKYQNDLNEYNNKLSIRNRNDNNAAIDFNQRARAEAATDQIWTDDVQARQGEARIRVAAGESSIAGNTVDSLMREVKGQQAMYANSVEHNLTNSYVEDDSKRRQIWNNYLSEVGNRKEATGGSKIGLGFQIAGAVANAYSGYQDGQLKQQIAAT